MDEQKEHIGFVSTRLAGTDGVSLETVKWSNALCALGHECFYFAGESDWPADRTYLVPEAHFKHPEIEALNADLFDNYTRSPQTSQRVQQLKEHLKGHISEFVRRFALHLLIVENALSLPMNVPLGLAIAEFIAENYFPTVAHHHDFAWERERYAVTAADDYLRAAFPPTLRSIHHVVINSFAGRQLALRTGAASTLIPNVMDFDSLPAKPDGYESDLRSALGIDPGECLLLQPTRIVPRKRIERALELARRLGRKCVVVVTHASGDEGTAYEAYLRDYARLLRVRLLLASQRINHSRGQTADGHKIYSMADAYYQADLVTYPSTVEGFGNAFLEAIYYRRPIVMSTYDIFKADIRPKGFQVIGFTDFIGQDTVRQAKAVLRDPDLVAEMTERNYELGRVYYSYRTLEARLNSLVSQRLRVLNEAGGYGRYGRS